jgi:hypothetical protein
MSQFDLKIGCAQKTYSQISDTIVRRTPGGKQLKKFTLFLQHSHSLRTRQNSTVLSIATMAGCDLPSMDCTNPWIPSKSIDWSIIHRFKPLNYYRNFFFSLFPALFFNIIPSYFVVFPYSLLLLAFFVLNILIVLRVFEVLLFL